MKAYVYLYVYIHTSYTTYLHIIIKEYIYKDCVSVFFTNFWKLKSKEHSFYFLVEERLLWFLSDIESITMWHYAETHLQLNKILFFIMDYWEHTYSHHWKSEKNCVVLFSPLPPSVTSLKYKSGHQVPQRTLYTGSHLDIPTCPYRIGSIASDST